MMLPIAKSVLMEIQAQSMQHQISASSQSLSQPCTDDSTSRYISIDDRNNDSEQTARQNGCENGEGYQTSTPQDSNLSSMPVQQPGAFRRLTKGLYISIAYSASIGSTATLTGSGTIRILAGDVLRYSMTSHAPAEFVHFSVSVCFHGARESVLDNGLLLQHQPW